MDFTPPRTLKGVTTLPVSESAVPNNGKVGNHVLCPHSRCFGSYFLFNLFDVSVTNLGWGFTIRATRRMKQTRSVDGVI